MKNTEKLMEAFGELLYVVAMADGSIQKEELATIEQKLANHKWGESIKWSFDYEIKKQNNIDDLYKKVISFCELHGPDKEYDFLLELVEQVAKASNGVDQNEKEIMHNFVNELTVKFRKDIERLNQN